MATVRRACAGYRKAPGDSSHGVWSEGDDSGAEELQDDGTATDASCADAPMVDTCVHDKAVRGDVAERGFDPDCNQVARFQTAAEGSGRSEGCQDSEAKEADGEAEEAERHKEAEQVSHEAIGLLVHSLLPT